MFQRLIFQFSNNYTRTNLSSFIVTSLIEIIFSCFVINIAYHWLQNHFNNNNLKNVENECYLNNTKINRIILIFFFF